MAERLRIATVSALAQVPTDSTVGNALAQTATVTLLVNSTVTPAATLVLQPGVPMMWYPGNGYTATAILGANVTALYASGNGVTTAQLDVRVLKG